MAITDPNPGSDRPARILHIARASEYERQRAAGGAGFVDPSLGSEGFIHCSTVDQFLIPANERFAGQVGLLLLIIEVDALLAPLVYEDCYESGMEFPHVYGPIDLDAVIGTMPLVPGGDGQFTEPSGLRQRL